MDKIRKLGAWLWLYKERILLLIVVGVLVWRVYAAINPPPPPPENLHPLPEPAVGKLPPEPDFPPKTLIALDRKELVKRNPFWYYAGGGGGTERTEKVDIELRGIQTMPDGSIRARLRNKGRTGFYGEGDKIDERYTLVSIDAENGAVTVRAERQDPVTIRQK